MALQLIYFILIYYLNYIFLYRCQAKSFIDAKPNNTYLKHRSHSFYFPFPFLIKMVTLFHLNSWWVIQLLPVTLSFPAVQNEASLPPITDKMHIPSGIYFFHLVLSYTLIFLSRCPSFQ